MKKLLNTLALFCYASVVLIAQQTPNVPVGSSEVNHNTGKAIYTHPIHTINELGITVPIYLQNVMGGIKVEDRGKEVGTGWNLISRPTLTRIKRGAFHDERVSRNRFFMWVNFPGNNDDIFNEHFTYGYLQTLENPLLMEQECGNDWSGPCIIDYEPDVFHFNLGGISGSFFIDIINGERVAIQLQKTGVKIEWNIKYDFGEPDDEVDDQRHIIGWKLTTPDGNNYLFGNFHADEFTTENLEFTNYSKQVEIVKATDGFPSVESYRVFYATEWFVSSIENQDNAIHFQYQPEYYYTQSQQNNFILFGKTRDIVYNDDFYNSESTLYHHSLRLSKIVTRYSELIFKYDKVRHNVNYLSDVDENLFPKLLSEIVINVGADDSKECYNKIAFNYSNPSNIELQYRWRYFLDNIALRDCNSDEKFETRFLYFEKELAWYYNPLAQDLWGYNNGANNDNLDYYPQLGGDGVIFDINENISANRDINLGHLKAGTLREVRRPNGSRETYDFESNTLYSKFIEKESIEVEDFEVYSTDCNHFCVGERYEIDVTFEDCVEYQILFKELQSHCGETSFGFRLRISVNGNTYLISSSMRTKAEILSTLNLELNTPYKLFIDAECKDIVTSSSNSTTGGNLAVSFVSIPIEFETKNISTGGIRIKEHQVNEIKTQFQYEFETDFEQESNVRLSGSFCEPCDDLKKDDGTICDSHIAISEKFFLGCLDEISLNVNAGFMACNTGDLSHIYIAFVDDVDVEVVNISRWIDGTNLNFQFTYDELLNHGLHTGRSYSIKIYTDNNDEGIVGARFDADHKIYIDSESQSALVSSGVLLAAPFNIGFYTSKNIVIDDKCNISQSFFLNTASSNNFASINPVETYYSKIHTFVGESKEDIGFTEYNFSVDKNLVKRHFIENVVEPNIPILRSYKRKDHMFQPRDFSLPKSTILYNSSGEEIHSISYHHRKVYTEKKIPYRTYFELCDESVEYESDFYSIYCNDITLESLVTVDDAISTTQEFTYLHLSNINLPKSTTTYNTNYPEVKQEIETIYSNEVDDYDFLIERNYIFPVQTLVNNGNGGGSKNVYGIVNDKVRHVEVYAYDSDGGTDEENWIKTSENIKFSSEGFVEESWSKMDPLNTTYSYENGLLSSSSYGSRTTSYFYDNLRRSRLSIDPTGFGTYIASFDEFHRPLTTKSGIVEDPSNINAVLFSKIKSTTSTNYSVDLEEDEAIRTDIAFPEDNYGLGEHSNVTYLDVYGRAYNSILLNFTQSNNDFSTSKLFDNYGRLRSQCSAGSGGCNLLIYENSPRGRVKSSRAPGASEFVEFSFGQEVPDIDNKGGYYIKSSVTDENGNTTRSYVDVLGREKIVIDALDNRTTYTYNERGQLLTVETAGLTTYSYVYDGFGRLESKFIPLKGQYTYGYDSYENLSSEIMPDNTIIYYNYHHTYNDFLVSITDVNTQNLQKYTPYFSDFRTSWVGVHEVKVLEQNNSLSSTYDYDEYGRVKESSQEFFNGSISQYEYFYDALDNIRLEHRIHSMGGAPNQELNISTRYEYDRGRRLTEIYKTLPEKEEEFLVSRHKYDDRDWQVYKNQGGLFAEIYKYNSRGWLTEINSISQSYSDNIKPCSSPESIYCSVKKPPNDNLPIFEENQPASDLFSMNLFYSQANNNLEAPRQHNGNISWMQWRVKGEVIQKYGFQYDKINRLRQAKYSAFDRLNCQHQDQGAYDVRIDDYDSMGNIESIKRRGLIGYDEDGKSEFGLIDDLNLIYENGFLVDVQENGNTDKGYKELGDGTGMGIAHHVGNMTSNTMQGIEKIEYNYLDLPVHVEMSSGILLDFVYDAAGNQLQMTKTSSGNAVVTDYANGIEIVDGLLESIYFEEGRCVYNQPLAGSNISPYLEFNITDHLGNVRVRYVDKDNDGVISVVEGNDISSEIIGSYHYYPFGMKMEGAWNVQQGNANKYQYNGIEHLDEVGLSFSMYRIHDPALGRWMQVDPKAEYLYSMSPYQSMGNNPILYNDPNGDFIPQLVGGLVGGIVNLADQALKGNVTSFGEGLAYFGTGAAAGVAVSLGQVGAARLITAGGNKAVQFATGKFDPGGIDSWGDVAGLALDVGTDLLSPGLTQAISKPITKSLLARGVANAIDDAVVAGGGNIIKQQLGEEAAEQLAKNSIEFSLTFSDEFVVSASRLGGGNYVNYLSGVTAKSFGKVVGEGTVNVGKTVSQIQAGQIKSAGMYFNREGHKQLLGQAKGYWRKYEIPGFGSKSPLRILEGRRGEMFLSPDHYKSIIPIGGF